MREDLFSNNNFDKSRTMKLRWRR